MRGLPTEPSILLEGGLIGKGKPRHYILTYDANFNLCMSARRADSKILSKTRQRVMLPLAKEKNRANIAHHVYQSEHYVSFVRRVVYGIR